MDVADDDGVCGEVVGAEEPYHPDDEDAPSEEVENELAAARGTDFEEAPDGGEINLGCEGAVGDAVVGPPIPVEQERHLADGGENGADGGAAQTEGRGTEVAKDEDPVEKDVEEGGRNRAIHEDARALEACEEAGKRGDNEGWRGTDQADAEIHNFERLDGGGVVEEFKDMGGEWPKDQEHEAVDDGQREGLESVVAAAARLTAPEAL